MANKAEDVFTCFPVFLIYVWCKYKISILQMERLSVMEDEGRSNNILEFPKHMFYFIQSFHFMLISPGPQMCRTMPQLSIVVPLNKWNEAQWDQGNCPRWDSAEQVETQEFWTSRTILIPWLPTAVSEMQRNKGRIPDLRKFIILFMNWIWKPVEAG